MQEEQAVRDRIEVVEKAKECLLSPPFVLSDSFLGTDDDTAKLLSERNPGEIIFLASDQKAQALSPHGTLESLNAELAALRWVLGD